MTAPALHHRAVGVIAAVTAARQQLGAAAASKGEGDTVGAWCDVLHAIEAARDLAIDVLEAPSVELGPVRHDCIVPETIYLRYESARVRYRVLGSA